MYYVALLSEHNCMLLGEKHPEINAFGYGVLVVETTISLLWIERLICREPRTFVRITNTAHFLLKLSSPFALPV